MRTDPLTKAPELGLLERLLAVSLENPLLVLMGAGIVAALGVRALGELPIDAVPDVTNVQVQVLTDSPGLGPLEVERFITTPVEQALSGLPHLDELRSLSRFGLSAVTIVFEDGTDIYWARQMVAERMVEAREAIPEGYGEPEMGPISSGLGEVFQFEVRGDKAPEAGGPTLMDLRDTLEWTVAPRLRAIPGVVEVNAFGGELRTWEVEVRPEALAARGLALADLYEALESNNANAGGGYVQKGREQVLVRGVALLDDLESVSQVVVASTAEGTPITVGNLGTVRYAPMIRQGAVTRDGRGEVVTGIAMMLLGENSRTVAQALRTEVEAVAKSLPDETRIEVFYDRTELIDRTIATVAKNLVEGAVLVVLVLLLTLGNLRGALIAALVIPLSLLVAFIGMRAAGVSGNLMSLGAIDFGLMVDGAVVVLEAVLIGIAAARQRGEVPGTGTVLESCRQVARPVVFAVGIIILVYLPILSLTGIEGRMFRPMAATVTFALIGSLVLALTVVPVLASLLLRSAHEEETRLVRWLGRIYRPALDRALGRPVAVGVASTVAFLGSLFLVPFLGAEFIPKLEEGAAAIQIIRPPSVSLEESIRQCGLVESALHRHFPDEIQTVICKTGRAEIATDPMGVDVSDVIVMLDPIAEWTKAKSQSDLVEGMQAALGQAVPGVNFAFSQPIELRVNELIEGVRSDVAVMLYGDDLPTLLEGGEAIAKVLRKIEGAEDVKVEQVAGLPMLRVQVDQAAIARLGMSATDVLDAVEAIAGRSVGSALEGRRRYPLQVRLPADLRDDPDELGDLLVSTPGGPRVPLDQVATLVLEEGPTQVSHENGQRRLTVEVNVRGRDVAGFVADAQARIDEEVDLAPGYVVDWGGSFENLEKASARLAVLVPLVLVFIFVLLQAMFGSVRHALLVYANVPLAATGGIVALLVRGLPFTISAGVGFITLFGIAVLNGIVLVSHMRLLEDGGRSPFEAALEGARERFRTVLMTTLVAAFGFLPMAISTTAGAEVQRPLATVVIGGLLTSTALTLFVLPALYAWAMKREDRVTDGRPVEGVHA